MRKYIYLAIIAAIYVSLKEYFNLSYGWSIIYSGIFGGIIVGIAYFIDKKFPSNKTHSNIKTPTNQPFEVNGVYYKVLDETSKTVEVTHWYNKYSGSITIPPSVTHNGISYSVTTIGEGAFSYCTGLTSITIPNSVTKIGRMAFYSTDLTAINIPNSVTEIDLGAFGDCIGLKSITIPNSVTKIDSWAFLRSIGLKTIIIQNPSVNIDFGGIPEDAKVIQLSFEVNGILYTVLDETSNTLKVTRGNNKYPGSITIPPSVIHNGITYSVTKIGNEAFYRCTGLTTITIPNSVTEIGKDAFLRSIGLKTIIIQNPDVKIGDDAIPEGVEVIIEK